MKHGDDCDGRDFTWGKKSKKRVVNNVASNFFANKFLITLGGLLILILGFLGGAGYTKYSSSENTYPTKATVKRIIDGDTVELDNKKSFRLYGISCPEKKDKYYQEAKNFTQEKVLNKKVNLEYEEKYKKGSYGRILGYIIVDGTITVNQWLPDRYLILPRLLIVYPLAYIFTKVVKKVQTNIAR